MNRAVSLLVVAILTVNTALAQSADSATARVLTYQEAINMGLRNGILLNQQKNLLEYNRMAKLSNIAGLGPTLNAQASGQRIEGNTFNQNEGKVVNGVFDQVYGSLNANLNLFSGFNQVNKARQASALLDAQAYYINRSEQDIINTISSQYLTVLLDGELLKIARENQKLLERQMVLVTEQVELGSKAPADQYNQDVQTKAAQVATLQAELQLINDQQALALTLLLDPQDEFIAIKPSWDVNAIGQDHVDINSLYTLSLQSRADYLRAKRNEDAAKYGAYAAKGLMVPSIGAFGTLYSTYNNDHTALVNAPFEQQFKTDNLKKVAGLSLYIPIFGGNQAFSFRTTYVQQKVAWENASILRKNAEIVVKTDVYKAFRSFEMVKKSYAISSLQVASAEKAFEFETERYNIGLTDFVTYLTANRALVQAQTQKAQAEYKLVFQRILMAYATGTLKTEDIEGVSK